MSYPETTTMATASAFNFPTMAGLDFGNDDLADDMEGLTLSFPKVKIPSGGALQFELPTGDPENPEYTRFLQGVILYHHASGAYWPEGCEYDDNTVPLCSTVDGKQGYGTPGGACAACELNRYGTATDGKGKACKNMRILYLLQDMREFELYGTVRAVISVCDSVNNITEPEELQEVFRLVNNYLDPKGVFIFDFNTRYKYEEILGDRTIAENREECSFIWDNYYYEDEKINEYDLSLFIETDKDSGLYRKYEETHYQRAYTLEEMKELIRKSGLEFVTAYDAFSKNAPMDTSERIYVIAREQGK